MKFVQVDKSVHYTGAQMLNSQSVCYFNNNNFLFIDGIYINEKSLTLSLKGIFFYDRKQNHERQVPNHFVYTYILKT